MKGLIGQILLLLFAAAKINLMAQDPMFSQYYASPLHTNPAFSGLNQAPSLAINYRNQWPLLDNSFNAYVTYSLSFDQYFEKIKSGIGVQLLADNAGDGILTNLKVALIYGYQLKLNQSTYIRGGFELGLVQMRYNWDRLVFGDQLDPIDGLSPGGTPIISQEIRPERTSITYLDLGTGMLFYTRRYYFGFSAKHINTPNINILGINDNAFEGLPLRWVAHGGLELPLPARPGGRKQSVSASALYAGQSAFRQVNVAVQYNMHHILVGLGYRHARQNPDAIILGFGLRKGMWKLGYSFDWTISRLGLGLGGGHECSFLVNLRSNSKKRSVTSDCFEAFR